MIAGLENPTAGSIFLGDRDVSRVKPQDRDVAMVFQNYALFPHLNVEQNIAFSLKFGKFPAGNPVTCRRGGGYWD